MERRKQSFGRNVVAASRRLMAKENLPLGIHDQRTTLLPSVSVTCPLPLAGRHALEACSDRANADGGAHAAQKPCGGKGFEPGIGEDGSGIAGLLAKTLDKTRATTANEVHLGSLALDLVCEAMQLHGVSSAVDSAKMPQEDQNRGLIRP